MSLFLWRGSYETPWTSNLHIPFLLMQQNDTFIAIQSQAHQVLPGDGAGRGMFLASPHANPGSASLL